MLAGRKRDEQIEKLTNIPHFAKDYPVFSFFFHFEKGRQE